VLGVACLWRNWSVMREGARYASLRMRSDFSLSLVTTEGSEVGVQAGGYTWVTRWLVVIDLDLPQGSRFNALVAPDRNDAASFRRISVLCRFLFAVAGRERQNGRQSITQGA
ncbi:MAG: hypothetical protein R3212_12630, partial [Xanthomonadales bacterium]|nr:hypothetical protein [Xanthomonadales bacterium]